MNQITKAAVEKAGGPAAVSRECNLSRQAVAKWDEVPPKHVLAIERLSGISRHELRPDIYGPTPAPLPLKPQRSAAHA